MSHNPERAEKNCLNCGTQVAGRYCQVCGQENVETRESFWSLAKHFVFDILHFDGKFFYTLKYLFTRPGYVARQYAEGKRASFLHPIRMYLFASAIFFLAFFSFAGKGITEGFTDAQNDSDISNASRIATADRWQKRLDKHLVDSSYYEKIRLLRDTLRPVNVDSMGLRDSILNSVTFGDKRYTDLAEYKADQDTLPAEKKDSWLKRRLITQSMRTTEKYGRSREGLGAYFETFLHKLPYFLFVSLPFFALILKLLYVRRKNIYYSDHAVFTLYHYIFSFVLLLLMLGISLIQDAWHWRIIGYLETALAIWWAIYLCMEMKNFYRQSWGKTIVKYLLLNILGFLVILFLFLVFLLFTFLQS